MILQEREYMKTILIVQRPQVVRLVFQKKTLIYVYRSIINEMLLEQSSFFRNIQ